MAGGGATSTSESTGYGYLPFISKDVANAIGQYQSQAANQAADLAKTSINDALSQITKNYTSAVGGLAPTTAAGYQAQLELNKYLGLDAVKPGALSQAPINPNTYTPSAKEINDYVKANSYVSQIGRNPSMEGDASDRNLYTVYGGEGAQYDGWSRYGNFGVNDPESGLNVIGTNGQFNWDSSFTDAQKAKIVDYLKQQHVDQNKDLYAAQQAQYNQDKALYDQNMQWYDKYAAEGPYTQEQITQNIANQPGYQAQQQAGTDAIQKSASARGLLSSGNMLKDLSSFASQLQGDYYNNTLNRLAQQASAGTGAATTLAGIAANNGNTAGSFLAQLGDTLANSALASGQAKANALQLGSQQYRQVVTGHSTSSQSSGGSGLSGLGSVLGGIGSLYSSGIFGGAAASSKFFKTKGKKVKLNLKDLKNLPVEKWKYTKESEKGDPNEEHIGPYAEDFKDVFGVGDGKTIPIVSSLGILYGLVKELDAKIDKRKRG